MAPDRSTYNGQLITSDYSISAIIMTFNGHFAKLEIRSMERGICPIAVFYFALKRSFFNI